MITPEQVDAHFAESVGILADHASGIRDERDGVVISAMGRGGPEFNTAWVMAPPRDPEATLRWAAARLASVGSPAMVQLRSALNDDVQPALAAAGFEHGSTLPAMWRAATDDVPPPPDGFRVVRVRDEAELHAFALASGRNFGAPDPAAMSGVFPLTLLDDERIAIFNGYTDGDEPVATGVGMVAGELAGVYAISVAESARRRGYGEAMTWAALAASARLGATDAVLQATVPGEPVYRRMGFVTVCDHQRFVPVGT